MSASASNANACVKALWQEGLFENARTLKETSVGITQRWGHNFSPPEISKALANAPFLRRVGRRGTFGYVQRTSPVSKKLKSVEEKLFSDTLLSKFGDSFRAEVEDLHLNFGRSGTCTAFLLRKILEKAIYLAFAKQGLETQLEDKSKPGRLLGLDAMLSTAARVKVGGIPFLLPRTVEKIKGTKFLGDASAHNPLTNVAMETILPQMPYIITAYEELAGRL